MKESGLQEDSLANATRAEIMSALFANMVIQQTNMASMLLGKMPHPETGEFVRDIETAKIFIDQLEMIEFKTEGNLDPAERTLLAQSLSALHNSFFEALEQQETPSEPATPPPSPKQV